MTISGTYYRKDENGRDLTPFEWIDYLVSIGFTGIEISFDPFPSEESERDAILSYAKSRGLTVGLHSSYGPNNIADTDLVNRRRSIDRHKEAIDLAAKYGLSLVVFHPGRKSSEEEDEELKWQELFPAVEEIAAHAKLRGVRVAIENMEWRKNEIAHTVADLNRFAYIAKDNPYLGAVIDFGHYVSGSDPSLPPLAELQLPLYNVHLSQCVGVKAHFPLNAEGKLDFTAVLSSLIEYGYEGNVTFETGGRLEAGKAVFDEALAACKNCKV